MGIDLIAYGVGGDVMITVVRVALGTFFAISGYHKLTNHTRHAALVQTLKDDHAPAPRYTQWIIPCAELSGGIALVAGFLTLPAALGLIVICLGACVLDGVKRIRAWQPLDRADAVDDVLYLPEVLYTLMLTMLIETGPGPISADYVLFG